MRKPILVLASRLKGTGIDPFFLKESRHMRLLSVVLLLVGLVGFGAVAQSGRPPGKYLGKAKVEADLEKGVSEQGIVGGHVATLVEADGGRMVVRKRLAGPNNASVHDDVTEIYQFIGGGGTFVTGGTLPDAKDRTAGIKNGVSQKVQPGDFVILLPGTPHWFSQIDQSVTYVETRIPVKK